MGGAVGKPLVQAPPPGLVAEGGGVYSSAPPYPQVQAASPPRGTYPQQGSPVGYYPAQQAPPPQQQQQQQPQQPHSAGAPTAAGPPSPLPGGVFQSTAPAVGAVSPVALDPNPPREFAAFASPARPAGAPPYERLLLVSSRVAAPMRLAECALPGVAVVVYDWRNTTMQELGGLIKKATGGSKVTSVGIVAPGGKPGTIALLDGTSTTVEKLRSSSELQQTWRHLAALTQPPGGSRLEGNRIDLLQCGVISNGPVEGAALLKELWAIAGIPVTASDDALSGFLLATFLEQAKTQSLSIIRSTIPGVDYYWRRADLLGSASPSQQYGGGGVPGGGIMAAYPGAPLPREKRDVLERFSHQAALQGTTPPALFRKADTAGAGKLSAAQVSGMCREVLPDVSVGDAQHFQAILGAEGEATITEPEFSQRLKEGAAMHAKLRAGQDESGLLRNLSKYMTDNEPIIRQFFEASDINGSGKLEHSELADFARCIPDLLPAEQKFIITFMNQSDANGDGALSFDELKAAVAVYGKQQGEAAGAPQADGGVHSAPQVHSTPPPPGAPVGAGHPPPAQQQQQQQQQQPVPKRGMFGGLFSGGGAAAVAAEGQADGGVRSALPPGAAGPSGAVPPGVSQQAQQAWEAQTKGLFGGMCSSAGTGEQVQQGSSRPAVQQAEAGVHQVQAGAQQVQAAALQQVQAGSRPAVQQAEAGVQQVQAGAQQAQAGAQQVQAAALQQAQAAAEPAVQQAQAGVQQAQVQAAQQVQAGAQQVQAAAQQQAQAASRPAVQQAQAGVQQAQTRVEQQVQSTAPIPQQVQQVQEQAQQLPQQAQETKKGLFGGLFGGKPEAANGNQTQQVQAAAQQAQAAAAPVVQQAQAQAGEQVQAFSQQSQAAAAPAVQQVQGQAQQLQGAGATVPQQAQDAKKGLFGGLLF